MVQKVPVVYPFRLSQMCSKYQIFFICSFIRFSYLAPPMKDSTPSFWILFPPFVLKPPTLINAFPVKFPNSYVWLLSPSLFETSQCHMAIEIQMHHRPSIYVDSRSIILSRYFLMCVNRVNVLFSNEPEYWRVQALHVFKYLSTTYSSRLHNGAKHSTQMNDHWFSLSCCNKFLI